MPDSVTPPASRATPVAAPVDIAVSDDLAFLDLARVQGDVVRISAERLRGACKCAHCLRARIDGVFPQRFEAIAIVQVAPVGGYAINIQFSDGHARGIYPWPYLFGLNEPDV